MSSSLSLKKQPKSSALSSYTLEKKFLCTFNKSTGSPSQRCAIDEHGNNVLIKAWPRNPQIDDKDLYEIWKNETRQLYRLAGYPGTADYIADLKGALIDEHGYYLIINSDQRRPLEILVREESYKALRNPRSSKTRRLTWANLQRLAKGLEILHLQGMLHRNLNEWSVLTADTDEPDFQLTGFEWSMRLVEPNNENNKRPPTSFDNTHSFLKDWQQLGKIATNLLGLPYAKITDLRIPNHEVQEGISSEEIKLIRELQGFLKPDRIDGTFVNNKIDKILLELDSLIKNQEQVYGIVFPFGASSKIASAIRLASKNTIETDDEQEQIDFIRKDLRNPIFQTMKSTYSSSGYKYTVKGESLTYTIDMYKKYGSPSSWDFAYCNSAEPSNRVPNPITHQISLNTNSLNIIPQSESRKISRLRGRTLPWSTLINKSTSPGDNYSNELATRKSLVLSQIIDYLFAASEVYPIDLVGSPKQNHTIQADGTISIKITSRPDNEREDLCKSLNLRDNLAKRLERALSEDRFEGGSVGWILTDSPNIGERSDMDTEWQFLSSSKDDDGRQIYNFTGENPPNAAKLTYLISTDSTGRDLQLRRRLKSFAALAEHNELARMIYDPRGRITSSHEQVLEDDAYLSLDPSKREAFKSIIETLPLFLVQGPPGVGKTRLVRELVRQILENDDSSRLLLSAQSNHAVDHLMHEIEGIISNASDPIIIRCVQKTAKDADKRFDIGFETKSIIGRVAKSELAKSESPLVF